MMRILGLCAAALVLGGCATVTSIGNTFEGAADYRVIPETNSGEPKSPLVATEGVPLSAFSPFQAHPPASDTPPAGAFSKGDFIQISLRTGTIGWFSEGAEQKALNDLLGSHLKGEIAIVANVTEGAVAPGGIDKEGKLDGRVVFYSGDIYRDQRLNEFNLPIHGPAKYEGGSLTIDMWVLELDRAESDQMGAVLSTLTRLSAQAPSVALPGINILNQIGTAFLKSNTDDIIGRLRVTLAAPRPGQRVTDPILQVSDVVVSRTSRISGNLKMLDRCFYLPLTSRVVEAANKNVTCGGTGAANRNNIFVFAIRKVAEGPSLTTAHIKLDELNDRLGKLQVGASPMPDLNAAIDEIGDAALSARAYPDSIVALEGITSGSAGGARQVQAERILRNLQCGLLAVRNSAPAVLAEACGERAASRQMSLPEISRLSQRLRSETCLSESDLSFTGLLTDTPTSEALAQRRAALWDLVRRRPAAQEDSARPCPSS